MVCSTMNALLFFCCALVMILSTFSRSMWIAVNIRTGFFSNGKLTPYFERQLRRLDIFAANDSRMIPRRMLHWGSRKKKLSQSLIGALGVFSRWTVDIFSKSNIHFLEVVSIKSTCEFKHIEWVLLETFYKSVLSSGPDASHLRDFSGR